MVFCIQDAMARVDILKHDRDPDAFLQAIRTLIEAYVNSERRLAHLEQRSDLGVVSYLVLSDAFANIRAKGALTKEVADFTVDEIVAYLGERLGKQSARLQHLVKALQDPEGPWE